MALDLADYERKAQVAVKAFWRNRDAARLKQRAAGNADRGERAGVTAGKNYGWLHRFNSRCCSGKRA